MKQEALFKIDELNDSLFSMTESIDTIFYGIPAPLTFNIYYQRSDDSSKTFATIMMLASDGFLVLEDGNHYLGMATVNKRPVGVYSNDPNDSSINQIINLNLLDPDPKTEYMYETYHSYLDGADFPYPVSKRVFHISKQGDVYLSRYSRSRFEEYCNQYSILLKYSDLEKWSRRHIRKAIKQILGDNGEVLWDRRKIIVANMISTNPTAFYKEYRRLSDSDKEKLLEYLP